MKLPQITKDELFASIDYCDLDKPFLDSFPEMPDPYKDDLLESFINLLVPFCLSDLGLLYCLPFFMKFILDNPRKELNLESFDRRIQKIAPEIKEEYKELMEAWAATLTRLAELDAEIGPWPTKHEFRPE